ncbi:3-oxoacyl-ACP reductase [Spongiibacter marinus]|uniref:3-oxoacyl-ACP reductase n=1 Tax=Spongiibacter marinus TaxID=354246 RepID=UPI00040022DD|nr:3-oxoacyl-ACP reductase [Spongiibacter marinus]
MSDRIENFINSSAGKKVLGALGVNAPRELARYTPSQRSFFKGRLLLGAGDNAALLAQVSKILAESDAEVVGDDNARLQCTALAQDNGSDAPFAALVFDATGMRDSLELVAAYRFFNANIRKLAPGGRIVILGRPHMGADNAEQAATQRALEGLSRSLAKEVGARGSTAQLITVASGAEGDFGSSLRFVLSPKSAYVTGQVIAVNAVEQSGNVDWHKPLAGKTALVTGASRGIGEAIADTLARDGATVIGVDVAPMEDDLVKVMTRLGGQPLIADITAEDAPAKIASAAKQAGGIDLIVHNAGVTRDKTIANMTEQQWQMTLDINLAAAQRITRELLDQGLIRNGGSIVGVSSMNGIGGQRGQTNYAASKAGVIGYVDFMKNDEQLRAHNITVNAVAPGFIETAMTAAIPLFTRMFGRRLNSLSQGGLPVDVAEAIAFFANPLSRGVSGNTLRVCGQSWFGA